MGMEFVEEGAVLGINVGDPINQWGLCGVVILCHQGWLCGSS